MYAKRLAKSAWEISFALGKDVWLCPKALLEKISFGGAIYLFRAEAESASEFFLLLKVLRYFLEEFPNFFIEATKRFGGAGPQSFLGFLGRKRFAKRFGMEA